MKKIIVSILILMSLSAWAVKNRYVFYDQYKVLYKSYKKELRNGTVKRTAKVIKVNKKFWWNLKVFRRIAYSYLKMMENKSKDNAHLILINETKKFNLLWARESLSVQIDEGYKRLFISKKFWNGIVRYQNVLYKFFERERKIDYRNKRGI